METLQHEQPEPTFPVITVVGLTRDEFDNRERAGALDIRRHLGGYWQVISIQRDASAAVLENLRAVAAKHPSMRVLTSMSFGCAQLPLGLLIAHFEKQKERLGA